MPTAKKSSVSPTQRTIALLKKRGMHYITRVEHWNHFARKRQDLWGLDVIAFDDEGVMHGYQITTQSHAAAREKKLDGIGPLFLLRSVHKVRIWVHGWRTLKRGKRRLWECDEREIL